MNTAPRCRLRTLLAVGLALAATLCLAGPAAADSVTPQGATVGAIAYSNQTTHLLQVVPHATPMAGWSSQKVWYEIKTYDREDNRNYYFYWYGPYVLSSSARTLCDFSGCATISTAGVPQEVPYALLSGKPGHTYDVWVQFAHETQYGSYYSGWVPINSCSYGNAQWTFSACKT